MRLYSPEQTPLLYVERGAAGSSTAQANISAVDVEAADLRRFPLFAQTEFEHGVLRPGDMLFIPRPWWHFVRSLSTSLSINFWF